MLDKSIEHGKEHRKQYRVGQAGAHDLTCRPNGGCPYCESSRLRYKKRLKIEDKEIEQDNGKSE